MKPQLSHWAAAGFEAARRLSGPAAATRSHGLHGHSFRVEISAVLEQGWGGVTGAESHALQRRLQDVVSVLDYSDLNTLMDNPGDAQLVHWITQRLALPKISRVHLWAGPAQGATRDNQGRVHCWTRDRFESAHRLPHVPAGHKCGRMHGHGFEVMLFWGQGDRGLTPIAIAWAPLRQQLHLACLNDIAGLENPTSENLSSWIWRQLIGSVPTLSAVMVFETASCGAVFDGQHYHIWKDRSFDSATRLKAAPAGDGRRRLHGHTYTLRLGLSGPLHKVMGWTVDFGDVKSLFSPVYRQLDHVALHETIPTGDSAAIAHWIHAKAMPLLPALDRICLFDTPATGVVLSCGGQTSIASVAG